jgi:enamine deaminase RidA (YjgF/YER057c/UK114 family)
MTPEERFKKLGLQLPSPPTPAANYVEYKIVGSLMYLAGHGPIDGTKITTGQVGADLTLEQGQAAAQLAGLSLLSTIHSSVGLNRVRGIVSLLGFVNSAPSFTEQPSVIDGCSNLLVEVWGNEGKHTRSAVGTSALPFNVAVEIEMVAELHPA